MTSPRTPWRAMLVLLAVLSALATLPAAGRAAQDDLPVRVTLQTEPSDPSDERLDAVAVTLVFEVRRGWKLYAREPGETGLPLRVDWHVPAGWVAAPARWPAPRDVRVFGEPARVHEGRFEVRLRLTRAATADSAATRVAATVHWAACRDVCVTGTAHPAAPLPHTPWPKPLPRPFPLNPPSPGLRSFPLNPPSPGPRPFPLNPPSEPAL